jgi:hypothetical protein
MDGRNNGWPVRTIWHVSRDSSIGLCPVSPHDLNSKVSENLLKILEKIGFRSRKPLVEKSRERLFANLPCEVPSEVSALYEICNGGDLASYGCRVYPLAEAVDLRSAYAFQTELAFLPFFVSENNESDPCMGGLQAPLTGYVFQLCDDLASRVLAPTISSFIRSQRLTLA